MILTLKKPTKKIAPVIKWSGSKRQVAPYLSQFIPTSKKYIEPFIGGGAMLPFRGTKNGLAGDIIPELIGLWQIIRDEPEKTAMEYEQRWNKLQKEGHEVYYAVRDSFNKERNIFDFLFLTRTCVNGLIRFNSRGDFNNSFHLTRPGIHPNTLKKIINTWSYYLQGVELKTIDYRETLAVASKGDFVFLDPPYGGTKGRYTKETLSIDDFFKELERLNQVGAKWMLTFDGKAGKRQYEYPIPTNIYKHKLLIKTGNSPFTKTMKTTIDAVYESVYLNFQPPLELLTESNEIRQQKATLF